MSTPAWRRESFPLGGKPNPAMPAGCAIGGPACAHAGLVAPVGEGVLSVAVLGQPGQVADRMIWSVSTSPAAVLLVRCAR